MHADRTPEAGNRASQAPGADGRVERAPVDAEPLCSLDHGEPLGRGRRGEEQGAREVGGRHGYAASRAAAPRFAAMSAAAGNGDTLLPMRATCSDFVPISR
jgi:hypothetical protein